MKITVGIKSAREAEYFFANGADEVYCGYAGLPNSRLPFENFTDLDEVEKVLARAAALKKKVFLAANVILRSGDYAPALRVVRRLADKGLAGLIVRDPALLAFFKREKFRFYFSLSTLANCFNSRALEFFADLGVSRVVLPMQMMPENAAGLINNRFGVETEVFCQALYYGINVDSRCELPCPQDGRTEPGRYRDFTCLLPFRSAEGVFRMPMPDQEYMLGAFYDFYKAGVRRAKVARWPNGPREADVFRKVKYLASLLEKGISRDKFISKGLAVDSKPLRYGKSFTFNPL